MRKTIIYISIIISNCASLWAQNCILTASANFPKSSDSIHYDFITATVPQNSCFSEQLWDFSNSKYLGQEKKVLFVEKDNNHIEMIDKDAILDFSKEGNHLFLNSLQTPLLNINFGKSFECLKYPFAVNDSLVCRIDGKGTYCSKNKLWISGTCSTKALAMGKLVMPSTDTLTNVQLLQRNIIANIDVSKDSVMSVKLNEPMKSTVTILEWYALGYRYPVLKVIETTVKRGGQNLLEQSFAYVADVESMGNFVNGLNKKTEAKMRDIVANSNAKQDNISYKITIKNRKVSLLYSLSLDSQLRFLISNTSGMIFKSVFQKRQARNNYRQDFDCSRLPSGEYVLYINVNGKTFAEKVNLQLRSIK